MAAKDSKMPQATAGFIHVELSSPAVSFLPSINQCMKYTKTVRKNDEDSPVPISVLLLAGLGLIIVFLIIIGVALISSSVQTQP